MRATLMLVLLVGCMNADKNPPPCLTAGVSNIADVLLRNPDTGQCEGFGPTCDPSCGPCPGFAEPDWAACDGTCDALDEDHCLASQSCHAAYQDSPTPSPEFLGCFELPPSGGITGGGCTGLDSQTCSEHIDCSSLYTSAVNAPPNFVPMFESCNDETPVSCTGLDCGTGNECVVTVDAPDSGQCEPDAVGGACTGLICQTPPPACPTGTTPGVDGNGCYTNFCIPTAECP